MQNVGFKHIIGQKEIISSLIGSIRQQRVGHAYLFTGPKGIGKRTVARAFANALLCKDAQEGDACGKCAACLLTENRSNPDYKEIQADGSSIGVEEIRSLQGDIVVKPLYSDRKVYLIADAGKMTVQAQNCLLKTLEEPPGYAVILLTSTSTESLLETIRSRVVNYSFKKYSPEEVKMCLEANTGSLDQSIEFILSYCDGIIGRALEIADSGEFAGLRDKTLEIVTEVSKPGLVKIFNAYDFFEKNKDRIDSIMDILCLYYRDLLLYKYTGDENLLINSDKKDMILKSVPGFSTRRILKCLDVIGDVRRNLKQNTNYQLTIEIMLMKLQEE